MRATTCESDPKEGKTKDQDVSNSSIELDPTFPHGTCSGSKNGGLQSSIVHPGRKPCDKEDCDKDVSRYVVV